MPGLFLGRNFLCGPATGIGFMRRAVFAVLLGAGLSLALCRAGCRGGASLRLATAPLVLRAEGRGGSKGQGHGEYKNECFHDG